MRKTIIRPMDGIRLFINSYSEPEDPDPPNNHRVELLIGSHRFIPDRSLEPGGGCTTRRKALTILREIENELNRYLRPKPIDPEEDPETLP